MRRHSVRGAVSLVMRWPREKEGAIFSDPCSFLALPSKERDAAEKDVGDAQLAAA